MVDRRSASWWRITVATDAADVPHVLKCEPVEEAERDSVDVFYVLATSKEDAGRKAWNRYCLASQRRRRERLISEGKCAWCGEKNDRAARKRCSDCLSKERARDARARGEDVPVTDHAASVAARAEEERKRISAEGQREGRLEALVEVRTAWRHFPTSRQFTEWLTEQLRDLGVDDQVEYSDGMTLQAIGDDLGVSKARAGQLERKALGKGSMRVGL